MGPLLPIFGSFIQLAVVGGIVYLIVRVVSNRGEHPTQGIGTSIRRFFLYTLMLVTLLVSGIGVAGLIFAAVSAGSQITRDTTAIAMSLAFSLVGVPVYTGLAFSTARRLRDDPLERSSFGWAAYVTVALLGSLVAVMSLLTTVVGDALTESIVDRLLLIHVAVWGGVWVGHWFAALRWKPGIGANVHLLLGSAVGLITTVIGSTTLTIVAFETIYNSFFLDVAVGRGAEPLVRPLIVVIVGLPVWWWYWLGHSRHGERTAMWHAYVLLLGVLGGVVLTISGAGVLLYSVLQWLIGDPSAASPAVHFASVPGALGSVITGGALWTYHAHVLGHRALRDRSEVDRIHDYLLTGAGLVVGASGAATLITVALDTISGRDITSTSDNTIVAGLTLLLVGGPLWWRYWSTTARARLLEPESELRSATRRTYVFLVLGVAALVAIIDLIVILFLVFEDFLDGSPGRGTIGDISLALGLLITAGAVAWYHFAVVREDRADAPRQSITTLREVTLIGMDVDDLAAGVSELAGVQVRTLRSSGPPMTVESVGDVLDVIHDGSPDRAVVISRGDDGFDVVMLED